MHPVTQRTIVGLALLAATLLQPLPHAFGLSRRACRTACVDQISACVANGGRQQRCRKKTIAACKRRGLSACPAVMTPSTSTTLSVTTSMPTSSTTTSTSSTTTSTCIHCYSSGFEPNDAFEEAAPLPSGPWPNLTISPIDTDWYRVSLPPFAIATVEITFPLAQGNLDLSAYTAAGQCLGGRLAPDCTWDDRTWEATPEVLSVFTGALAGQAAFRVTEYEGSSTEYAVSVSASSYVDAPDCTLAYLQDECEGRPDGELRLVQFPFPNANEGYVGDGYRLESPANYRWARRELIMLVRHALHQTQMQFPGTKPLGIGDISQRNALTPGADVGNPRHAESTHDQGSNVDLAYFTTLARDGVIPYNQRRVVCDPNGQSNDGAFCNPSAAATHVVDLERQVYFLAQLFDSPRLRVIGVDEVLVPALRAEAQRQLDLGIISQTARNGFQSKLGFGVGWPFQHDGTHVSLNWWN